MMKRLWRESPSFVRAVVIRRGEKEQQRRLISPKLWGMFRGW